MTPPRPPWLRRHRRLALSGLAAVTLLAFAPLLSVLFTSVVAGALDCRVDEASTYPCPGPFGTDLGELLTFTGMMGWFMLVTAPFMLATALAWAVLALWGAWRLLRRALG